jgi:hypothetical protein
MTTKTDREYAIHLVNQQVIQLSGGIFCLADLSDSNFLCIGLDDLENEIADADEFTSMSEIRNIAQGIAYDVLECEGFPFHI